MNNENPFKKILAHFTSNTSGKKTIKHETVHAIHMASGLGIEEDLAEKQIKECLIEDGIEPVEIFTEFHVDNKENKKILRWKATLPEGCGVVLTRIYGQDKREIISLENANWYEIHDEIRCIYELSIEKEKEASIAFYEHLNKEKIKKELKFDPNNSEINDNPSLESPSQTTDEEENNNPESNKAFGNTTLDTKNINKKNFRDINRKKGKVPMGGDRRVSRWFIFLLGYWAIMPIVMVILGLSFSSLPFSSEFWSWFATMAPLFWVISSLLLISRTEPLAHWGKWLEDHIGLICTLTIGVAGILFGALSLLQHPMDFPHQISFIKSSVNLDISPTKETAKIFLFDVSDSFFSKTNKKNYDRMIAIMELILDFDEENKNNKLSRADDAVYMYAMSENKTDIAHGKIKFMSMENKKLFKNLDWNEMMNYKEKSKSQNTNIIKILDNTYSEINGIYIKKQKYSHINILIFSDFMHDIGKEPIKSKIQEDLWRLTSKIKKYPNLSLTAFYGPSFAKDKKNEINLLPYLENGLSNKFEKIDMRDVDVISIDKSDMAGIIALKLYKKESLSKPLYLGYRLLPKYFASAKLVFSKTLSNNIIYADLHKSNNEISNIKVSLGKPDIVLNTLNDGNNPIKWESKDNNKTFSVKLKNGIKENRSERYEIHLSFPELAVTKIIPLVLIPLLNDKLALTILGVVLLLLLIPIFVAYSWYLMLKPRLIILFVCTDNSCLSQIAEAWTKELKWKKFYAYSAGFRQQSTIDKKVIIIMKKIGVDISTQCSKHVETIYDESINPDFVIILCSDSCNQTSELENLFPLPTKHLQKLFKKPSYPAINHADKWDEYENVRDEIRDYIENKLKHHLKS